MIEPFGLLNINKPSGPTSHDIVVGVRRGAQIKRVGHAGTLDPLADGILILALGKAVRLVEYLMQSSKRYRASIVLGKTTNTYDVTGEVTGEQAPLPNFSAPDIEAALAGFCGAILQTPPIYSAIKVQGKAAHARARAGEAVEMAPRKITIYELTLADFAPPHVTLEVSCSPGTYIRALAHDLGQALGCGAVLESLTRTASGAFDLADAIAWDALQIRFEDGSWRDYVIPADQALPDMPRLALTDEQFQKLRTGAPFTAPEVISGLARGYTPDGQFIAVIRGDPEIGVWRPHKVFI